MTYCAICADVVPGVAKLAPFGRADAWVPICRECDTSPPVERNGPRISYEPESSGGMRDLMTAVARDARAKQKAARAAYRRKRGRARRKA